MLSSAIRSSLRSSSRLTARSAAPNRVSAFRTSRFRKYSTETPKSSSSGLLWAGVGAAAVGGVAWYFYSSDDAAKGAETALKSGVQSAKVAVNFVPTKADYQKVCCHVISHLSRVELSPRGVSRSTSRSPNFWTMLAMLDTMTVHTAQCFFDLPGMRLERMTKRPVLAEGEYVLIRIHPYDGSNDMVKCNSNYATMRFEPEALHGANNGLNTARALMEKVKVEFPWISYGDLWTLAGVAAVQEMAGPKIPWRPGRIDGFAKDATPDGRLPDAAQGAPHVRNIFNRMGYGVFHPFCPGRTD